MEPGWTCSQCHAKSAVSFCCCGSSETFLCKSCLATHYTKLSKRVHQNLPLAAYGHHKAPGYFDRLNARVPAVEAGKEALVQQLQLIDRCWEDISDKINDLYKRLWEAAQKAGREFKNEQMLLQEKVQLAIEEAERTLYEDNPVLIEAFSPALRGFVEKFPFTLFQYELKVCENMDSVFKFTYKFYADVDVPVIHDPSKDAIKEYDQHLGLEIIESMPPNPAVPESSDNWSCSRCSFSNKPEHQICYQCKSAKGDGCAQIAERRKTEDFSQLEICSGHPQRKREQHSLSNIQCENVSLTQVKEEEKTELALRSISRPSRLWKCTACAFQGNWEFETHCRGCNQPKAATVLQAIIPRPHRSASSDVAHWTCEFCRHPAKKDAAGRCTKCRRAKDSLRRILPSKKCLKCRTREVSPSLDICAICMKEMTSDAPYTSPCWICVKCSYFYNLIGEKCSKCHRTQEEVFSEQKKEGDIPDAKAINWTCNICCLINQLPFVQCQNCNTAKDAVRSGPAESLKVEDLANPRKKQFS